MFFKKLICLFLLVFLAGRSAIAENAAPVFTTVKTGDKAPFAGFLFTPEAIAQIYSKCTEERETVRIECNADVVSLNLEIERVKELSGIEIANKNKLIADITALKDKELKAKDKLIVEIESERARNKFYIAGAFIGGILLTGTIFYFATGINK